MVRLVDYVSISLGARLNSTGGKVPLKVRAVSESWFYAIWKKKSWGRGGGGEYFCVNKCSRLCFPMFTGY